MRRPPAEWPSLGAIAVRDLEVRYRANLAPVLKGLTFQIAGIAPNCSTLHPAPPR